MGLFSSNFCILYKKNFYSKKIFSTAQYLAPASCPSATTPLTVGGLGAGTTGTVSLVLHGRNTVSDRQVVRGEILTQTGATLLGRSASVDCLVVADGTLITIQNFYYFMTYFCVLIDR